MEKLHFKFQCVNDGVCVAGGTRLSLMRATGCEGRRRLTAGRGGCGGGGGTEWSGDALAGCAAPHSCACLLPTEHRHERRRTLLHHYLIRYSTFSHNKT